ncbi:MAG: channel protein hemolysin family [Anaerosolibacter sp.]|jgi:hemolysin III|uniref:PAQR family membrane homeostasis protein TrhA n=1 Tax=Anaerosolibacter sp. TaxID=1872527 RepID=UPI0026239758|nr:hemolysin III family protein [Anaerosolibacter sp.]MDF2548587.1 channel protein hemolysin family [Anaerosolibacter sp.]
MSHLPTPVELNPKSNKRYTLGEEIANSVTHGIGVLFSIVTLTILLVYAIWKGSVLSIIGFSIYGFCSICLYLSSTLYHSFQNERIKGILRVFDHSSIYLFIAGTYTPITLLAMRGYWRIGILSAVWIIAVSGILFKVFTYNRFEKYKIVSLALYIAMGWLVVIAINPMLQMVPLGFLMWLLAGGIIYTVGTVFYAIKRIPYNHAIWHIFVLSGSIAHFIGIFIYLK